MEEQCHIVLHEDASNADIVKSTLALTILRQKLVVMEKRGTIPSNTTIRTSHCWDILKETRQDCDQLFPSFLRELSNQKWAPPSRFMFGRVHMRAHWPLQKQGSTNNNTDKKKNNNNNLNNGKDSSTERSTNL